MFDSSVRRKAGAAIFALLIALASTPRIGVASTVSCNIPQPCALSTNAHGPGFEGVTTYQATATSAATYGLEGVDSSTNKNPFNIGYTAFRRMERAFAATARGESA